MESQIGSQSWAYAWKPALAGVCVGGGVGVPTGEVPIALTTQSGSRDRVEVGPRLSHSLV